MNIITISAIAIYQKLGVSLLGADKQWNEKGLLIVTIGMVQKQGVLVNTMRGKSCHELDSNFQRSIIYN